MIVSWKRLHGTFLSTGGHTVTLACFREARRRELFPYPPPVTESRVQLLPVLKATKRQGWWKGTFGLFQRPAAERGWQPLVQRPTPSDHQWARAFLSWGWGAGGILQQSQPPPKLAQPLLLVLIFQSQKKEGTFENCFFVCLSRHCTREGGPCLLEAPGGMAKDGLGLGPGSMWGAGGGGGDPSTIS